MYEFQALDQITQVSAATQEMVSQLQSGAAGAVVDMSKAKQMAEEASEEASKSGEALTDILAAVNSIVEMTTQIASATEQQRATAAEMTQNVEISSGAIEELAGDISQVNQSSRSLADMADQLNTLMDASAPVSNCAARGPGPASGVCSGCCDR
ncbi:hypothetical protein [Marinobacter sp. es.048]|uniref:hypothetical protein n=1 Tax=Marinobacter sp. es.048 TaxID=1761795 RepID=UPI000B58AC3A|nr:hypothetical protein [Marinobacter sp. es.048]